MGHPIVQCAIEYPYQVAFTFSDPYLGMSPREFPYGFTETLWSQSKTEKVCFRNSLQSPCCGKLQKVLSKNPSNFGVTIVN